MTVFLQTQMKNSFEIQENKRGAITYLFILNSNLGNYLFVYFFKAEFLYRFTGGAGSIMCEVQTTRGFFCFQKVSELGLYFRN